jgi:hypothetical protein
MRETAIARFLAGEATAAELEGDGGDLTEDFDVEPDMLLRFVDAAEQGELPPRALTAAAKTMLDSDRFAWMDDWVGVVLYRWSTSWVDLAEARRSLSPGEPTVIVPPRVDPSTVRTMMLICGGICILCEAIVFIGTAVIGPSFAESALGTNLLYFGIAFCPLALLIIFFARARHDRAL